MPTKIFRPLGVNVATVESTPSQALGIQAQGQDNSQWIYVLANSAIVAGMAVGLSKTYGANPLTKAHVDANRKVAVAQVAFAAGQYGWVATRGGNDLLSVRAKNACLPNVKLYTTSTAGYLDDTSGSQTLVQGITLTDTSTATGALKTCFISVDAHQ